MKGTVAIIGANQTGLFAAKLFSEQGFSVFVFEKNSRENAAYEWTDDISPSVFKEVGLPFPPNDIFTRTGSLTFVPPGRNPVFVPQNEEPDINVSRRGLNEWLISLLSEGVELYFDACVTRALADGDVVYGVEFSNGETFECDLVVDCGGVNSLVRRSLPQNFQIQNEVSANDKLFVKREFFARPENCPRPEHPKKIYLKHKNENGISRCTLSHDEKQADVLVGRIGSLSDETYENAIADLKEDNPVIGNKVSGGDVIFEIPVRRPLSNLVANGYVLLGDSACMTIPIIGSGIGSGLKAAKMLADAVTSADKEPFSKKNLYRYQLKFMREIGGKHAAIELVKNKLFSSRGNEIDDLVKSGVMEGLASVVSGGSAKRLVKSFLVLPFKCFSLWKTLFGVSIKAACVVSHSTKMPPRFDEKEFEKWRKKYDKPFNK